MTEKQIIRIMDCDNCEKEFCDHCATLKMVESAGGYDDCVVIYGSDTSETTNIGEANE